MFILMVKLVPKTDDNKRERVNVIINRCHATIYTHTPIM